MAGIGFELRKLLQTRTYTGLLRAYGYAGLISSGPWVLSIIVLTGVGLGLVGLKGYDHVDGLHVFLVSVTYLVAVSLIVTGLTQLLYTRFAADLEFAGQAGRILPNMISLLIVNSVIAGVLGLIVLIALFGGTSLLYRLEMLTTFVVLCNIWILTVFLGGMKRYQPILWCFAAGYGLVLVGGFLFSDYGLEGLLGVFCVGQAVLMFSLLWLVLRNYPGDRLVSWEMLKRNLTYRSLIFTGFFYNVAIWIDKFLFWYNPHTSEAVIGPLRWSPIYDFPIFLAYLTIVPGMAVFLIRMETDFAEHYDSYYDAVREGDTLQHIEGEREGMIDAARQGIYEIFKVQGITVAILLVFAPALMRLLGFSTLYVPLFDIDMVGVGVQVLLLGVLNTLFYLNKLKIALGVCALFAVANFLLTVLTQWLGVPFYGYGFTGAVSIATLVGLAMLSGQFDRLTYQTFMFQPGAMGLLEREAAETKRKARRRGRNAPLQSS